MINCSHFLLFFLKIIEVLCKLSSLNFYSILFNLRTLNFAYFGVYFQNIQLKTTMILQHYSRPVYFFFEWTNGLGKPLHVPK